MSYTGTVDHWAAPLERLGDQCLAQEHFTLVGGFSGGHSLPTAEGSQFDPHSWCQSVLKQDTEPLKENSSPNFFLPDFVDFSWWKKLSMACIVQNCIIVHFGATVTDPTTAHNESNEPYVNPLISLASKSIFSADISSYLSHITITTTPQAVVTSLRRPGEAIIHK